MAASWGRSVFRAGVIGGLKLTCSGFASHVLDDWCPSIAGLFLYYPSHRHLRPGLRAFIDVTTPPVRQKFCAARPLITQPPPPKADQPPLQSFWTHTGRRSDAVLLPMFLDGLGRNTRGNMLTSRPNDSWCRKRYLAASSMLLGPKLALPAAGLSKPIGNVAVN